MSRRFVLSGSQLILAIALMLIGAVSIYFLTRTELDIVDVNFTSIALLLGGLIFYSGVLVIVSMFKDETYLSAALLFPSIVAVSTFVYWFFGLRDLASLRVLGCAFTCLA